MKDLLRALSLLKPYRRKLIVIFVITVLLGIIEIIPSFIYKKLVDTISSNPNDTTIFSTIITIAAVYYAILFIQTVLNVMIRFYSNIWSKQIQFDLVQNTAKNLYSIQQHFFLKNSVGELLEKLKSGVSFVSSLYFNYMIDIIAPLVTAALSISILLQLDYRIGLVIISAVPLYFIFFKKAMDAINKYTPERRKMEEKAHGKLTEALYSIESTKVNSTPDEVLSYTRNFQNKALALFYEQNKRRQIWGGLAGQTQDTVLIGAIVLSSYLIYYGTFTLGDLVLVTGLSTNLLTPIRRILFLQLDLKEALIGIKRLLEILDAPKESELFSGSHTFKRIQGKVIFDQVSFGYQDNKKVLKNISFSVDSGTTIALVGPSGSGKTTITKLICGLYIPNKGDILIDGVSIKVCDLASLRKNLAVVFQDPFVLSDTLKNNLKFVKPYATNKEIDKVVSLSNMSEFIKQLPDGLDTQVGERGIRLSGGQKQRLAIAQALLKDAPIIIFDEATSSLDSENERLIQEAMRRLMRNRTTFIISHRLATVIHADMILVLKNGSIVEQGNHTQLRKKNGLYQKLYTLQMKDPEQREVLDLV